ncbi:MAG: hypothetical protein ACK4F9_05770 [Brevinematia bacterium]
MKRYLPFWFYFGIFALFLVLVGVIFRVNIILTWLTPVFWTGYILLLDGIIYSFKGKSFIASKGFFIVFLLSVVIWWFFEWTNIFLSNWHYENLPGGIARYIGYFWAFGTIMPAILLTYGLFLVIFKNVRIEFRGIPMKNSYLTIMISVGILFLLLPIIPFSLRFIERSADIKLFSWLEFLLDFRASEYMAFAVWTSCFLILDPINYLMQKPSILWYLEKGNYKVIALLSLTGLICGVLWESVNWFASTRWFYTVPILGNIKLFEMPILGYLGFITFSWEIYDIVSFLYKPAILRIQEWLL